MYIMSVFNQKNHLKLQEIEQCGEKVAHLTSGPLLKRSF